MSREMVIDFSSNRYPFGVPPSNTLTFVRRIVPFNEHSYDSYKLKFELMKKLSTNPNIIRLERVLQQDGKFHLFYEHVPFSFFECNKNSCMEKIKLIYLSACFFENKIVSDFSIENIGLDSSNDIKYYLDIDFEIETNNMNLGKIQTAYIEQIHRMCLQMETRTNSNNNERMDYSKDSNTNFDSNTIIKTGSNCTQSSNISGTRFPETPDTPHSKNNLSESDIAKPISPSTKPNNSTLFPDPSNSCHFPSQQPSHRPLCRANTVASIPSHHSSNSPNSKTRNWQAIQNAQLEAQLGSLLESHSGEAAVRDSNHTPPTLNRHNSQNNNSKSNRNSMGNSQNTLQMLSEIQEKLDKLRSNMRKRSPVEIPVQRTVVKTNNLIKRDSNPNKRKYSGDPQNLSPIISRVQASQSPKSVRNLKQKYSSLQKISEAAIDQENYRKESEEIKKQKFQQLLHKSSNNNNNNYSHFGQHRTTVTNRIGNESAENAVEGNFQRKPHKTSVAISSYSTFRQPSTSIIAQDSRKGYRNSPNRIQPEPDYVHTPSTSNGNIGFGQMSNRFWNQNNNTFKSSSMYRLPLKKSNSLEKHQRKESKNHLMHLPTTSTIPPGNPKVSASGNQRDPSVKLVVQRVNEQEYVIKKGGQYNNNDQQASSYGKNLSAGKRQMIPVQSPRAHQLNNRQQQTKNDTIQSNKTATTHTAQKLRFSSEQDQVDSDSQKLYSGQGTPTDNIIQASNHSIISNYSENSWQKNLATPGVSNNYAWHNILENSKPTHAQSSKNLKLQGQTPSRSPNRDVTQCRNQMTQGSHKPGTIIQRQFVLKEPRTKNDFEQLKKHEFNRYLNCKQGYVQQFLGVLDDPSSSLVISQKNSNHLTVPMQDGFSNDARLKHSPNHSSHTKSLSRHQNSSVSPSNSQLMAQVSESQQREDNRYFTNNGRANDSPVKGLQSQINNNGMNQNGQSYEQGIKKSMQLKERISKALLQSDEALEKYRKLSIHTDIRPRRK